MVLLVRYAIGSRSGLCVGDMAGVTPVAVMGFGLGYKVKSVVDLEPVWLYHNGVHVLVRHHGGPTADEAPGLGCVEVMGLGRKVEALLLIWSLFGCTIMGCMCWYGTTEGQLQMRLQVWVVWWSKRGGELCIGTRVLCCCTAST